MKNKQFFILILLLVIGFASISATLVINGNTKVAANLDDFNVVFIEAFLNGETNENVVISGDKKTLTFTTDKLTDINDSARLDYKVKNISTQYDGDVTINCTNEATSYVNITSSFDGKTLPLNETINMQAQEVKSGYINAELTKAVPEDQEVKITCKIEVSATSRTNYAYSLSFDSNGGSDVEDKIVEYNSNYGELSIPEKEGYTFIGWFNDEDIMVDETTVLNTKGNKTLTAKWAENAYPVEIKKVYIDKTETETINIPYGEYVDTLITVGEEYYISDIECSNGYTIDNFKKDNIIYNEQTIRINNNNIAKESTCTIMINKGIFAYSYTGVAQEFIANVSGNYKLEVWGAKGGGAQLDGGYASGNKYMIENDRLYAYVGEAGDFLHSKGTFNGGGACYGYRSGSFSATNGFPSGGGGTDFRTTINSSYKDRIIVAGGSGGSSGSPTLHLKDYGFGGGGKAYAYKGISTYYNNNGAVGGNCSILTGCWGAECTSSSYVAGFTGGGGGGYVGGRGIKSNTTTPTPDWTWYAIGTAEGGTNYIGGVTDGVSITGNGNIPQIEVNTNGNGYAKITYLGK